MAWHAGSNAVWWCALIARYSMPSMSGGEPAVRELGPWGDMGSGTCVWVGGCVGLVRCGGFGFCGLRICWASVWGVAGNGQRVEFGVLEGLPLS
jgi:hypothetical protein